MRVPQYILDEIFELDEESNERWQTWYDSLTEAEKEEICNDVPF